MITVGNKVFFCDLKNKKVSSGVLFTTTVSQSGYIVHIVLDDKKQKYNLENNLIFENEQDAINALPNVLDVKEKMEAINKQLTSQLDELRTKLIGKPEVKDVADSIYC